jgi:hypothetical protein
VAKAEIELGATTSRIDQVGKKRIDETDITAAFANFDNVWGTLSSREQAKLVRLLISQVEFESDERSIEISFHPSAIRELTAKNLGDAALSRSNASWLEQAFSSDWSEPNASSRRGGSQDLQANGARDPFR